jgi:hypothetical protein
LRTPAFEDNSIDVANSIFLKKKSPVGQGNTGHQERLLRCQIQLAIAKSGIRCHSELGAVVKHHQLLVSVQWVLG